MQEENGRKREYKNGKPTQVPDSRDYKMNKKAKSQKKFHRPPAPSKTRGKEKKKRQGKEI
jgi:hypothetical protein